MELSGGQAKPRQKGPRKLLEGNASPHLAEKLCSRSRVERPQVAGNAPCSGVIPNCVW